ncbi:GntR family transcriptional regulator [Emticicia sp. BO119]|uniref:GntR family transcriptional regulator n=1 Tax=Emticicia sp. BO119 TaxID=2757768 RepID=UPI0015F079D0|nr:GntR family transcriptional regulator [Emticicia sp. BO119]MBA4851855.1 GntR family transcriptional regulator [Emticicia sp. BO119]
MYKLQLNPNDKTPKYKQIVRSIITDIERTVLNKNEQLPSISELSEEYYLARDTVEKAYRELKEQGFITAVQGKGFYINGKEHNKMRILLIFNKLSSYKKLIYYAFLKVLGEKAAVDLQIHHYNARIFEEIIEKNLGKYNYYVIMPHFFPETDKHLALKTIEKIPTDELVLLDKDLPDYQKSILSVYQDFENDIFDALESAKDLLEKYQRMVLIFPSDGNYPKEIVKGFRFFCINSNKEYAIKENAFDEILQPKTAYVVVEETDLAELIKKTRQTNYLIGQDIGIVSFNETTLKELLEITVITTDFETMGRTAAALLLDKKQIKVKNPFYIIRRKSL